MLSRMDWWTKKTVQPLPVDDEEGKKKKQKANKTNKNKVKWYGWLYGNLSKKSQILRNAYNLWETVIVH